MSNIYYPGQYLSSTTRLPITDRALNFDEYARAAIEVFRSSYLPLPAGSPQEYAAFFSKKNYEYLYNESMRQSGGYRPDSNELFESMIRAYSVIQPRGDEMDLRRELYTTDVTNSYVNEMNVQVLDHIVPIIIASNKLWDHLAKYRHKAGYEDYYREDDGGLDTRKRNHGSIVDSSYLLP
jgi:hypothetical protein